MKLETVEINPSNEAVRTIIWLHGLGADGHDFVSIVPQLGIQETQHVRFIFPHAPIQPVTINGGMHMRAWFDIYLLALNAKIDTDGIARSKTAIEALIEQETARGIESKNIIIAGFSQGAVMALTVGLQFPSPLAGIIALSGYLPNAPDVLSHLSKANRQCPIFLAHGTIDPIVPYPLGLQTKEWLEGACLPVSWHSYPVGHGVCGEEVEDIGAWIKKMI